MFKKFIVFLLFVGLAGVSVGVILSKGDFNEIKATLKGRFVYEYEYIKTEGEEVISDVKIDLVNNNISLFYSVDETYSIDYYNTEKDAINVSIVDGKLIVKGIYKRLFNLFDYHYKTEAQKKVNIYLPASYSGNIKIDLTAGSLNIKNFNLENLNIDSTSGVINITESNFNNINIDLTSGYTSLKKVNANNSIMNATSGKIIIENSKIDNLSIDLTSGKIDIVSLKANVIKTVVTSGETDLNIIGNVNDYKAVLESLVGKIHYDGNKYNDITINPNGAKLIEASCTSGNIIINFINE